MADDMGLGKTLVCICASWLVMMSRAPELCTVLLSNLLV
jgi:SNF2 family DNA or RNA helicase